MDASVDDFDPNPAVYECSWADVVSGVRDHRVAQTVIGAPWFDGLSEEARDQILDCALVETAHAIKLCADTEEVCAVLSGVGVRHLVVKGVALAFMQRRPLTERGSGDVDVWVPPDDFVAAQSALGVAGWAKHPGITSHLEPSDGWRWTLLHGIGSERSFGRSGRCDVDLHWRLVPAGRAHNLTFDQAWARSVPVEGLSGDVRTLCSRDGLAHVAAHGLKDGWATLRDLADVVHCARVIELQELAKLAQSDPNVALALVTGSKIDSVLNDAVQTTHRRASLASEGLAGCLSLRNRNSIRLGLSGLDNIQMHWSRASWSVRSQESTRGAFVALGIELMPFRFLLGSRPREC